MRTSPWNRIYEAARASFLARAEMTWLSRSPALDLSSGEALRQRGACERRVDRFDIRGSRVVAPHKLVARRERWLLLEIRIFTVRWRQKIVEIGWQVAVVSHAEQLNLAANRLQLALHAALRSFLRSIGELRDHNRGEDAENDDDDENFDERESATNSALDHGFLPVPRGFELIRSTDPRIRRSPHFD